MQKTVHLRRFASLLQTNLSFQFIRSCSSPACTNNSLRAKSVSPPSWIEQIRRDCKKIEKEISYDIKIYDELAWRKRPFEFSKEAWDPARMSGILRRRLCLGNELTEYTVIGEAFPFPDRNDSPVINNPQSMCCLLWDHNSDVEKILIQLSSNFPPLLWISIKPTITSLKRLFSEFLDADTVHATKYLPYYEQLQNSLECDRHEKLTETLNPSYMKDRYIADMRKRNPQTIEMDYNNEHNVFTGTQPHFSLVENEFMKTNPFVFGWPLLLSDGNEYLEGTPLRMAAFRSIYSKSLLLLHSRLDLQVNHREVHLGDDENEDIVLEVPVFCTINYPSNKRLCGGKPLVERYNNIMETSYPHDIPIDVIAAFARETVVKGHVELLAELSFLSAASEKVPEAERVFRISENELSTNRICGQLAYTIVYLALTNYDKFVENVYHVYKSHFSDMVRVACAKGVHLLDRDDLLEQMIEKEPIGRSKSMMEMVLNMKREETLKTRYLKNPLIYSPQIK